MIYLNELSNRLYFYTPNFQLGYFENANGATTLFTYSQTFTSYESLINFFLFVTNQDALAATLAVMPESLPFTLRYEKAVKVVLLKEQLQNGVVNFTYSKKEGATRPAVGTLLPAYLPEPKKGKKKRPTPKHLLKYWDLEAGAYRQFIKANIH